MRTTVARARAWVAAPQVFEVSTLVAVGLLLLLESRTPWEVTYTPLGVSGFVVDTAPRPGWGVLGSLLLVLAPLASLRSTWLGVALVVPRLAMGYAAGESWPFTAYAALVAVAICSSWRRPRLSWLVAGLALVVPMVAIWSAGRMMTPGGSVEFGLFGKSTSALVVTTGLYVVATVAVMMLVVLLRREAGRERDLRDLLRGRREVQREATILDERSRLARDLHDVVAHHVSLIAVRAETAPYTCTDLPPEARLAFAEIADESRLALHELRGVLGVLRRTGDTAPRSPQPGAPDIERLVVDARVTHTVTSTLGDLDRVAATPGYIAYRVVQEALTNARRHAPEARVDVVAQGDGEGGIIVRVSNPAHGFDPDWQHGQGITGMTERVAAAGGRLEVGPRGGAFVVEARLPHESDEHSEPFAGGDA